VTDNHIGWRTMLDILLTGDVFVGKLWISQQPFISAGLLNESNPDMDYGVETSNSRPGLRMAVWLQVKLRGRRIRLRAIGCTTTVCDRKHHCSMRFATLCYMPLTSMLLTFCE